MKKLTALLMIMMLSGASVSVACDLSADEQARRAAASKTDVVQGEDTPPVQIDSQDAE